MSRKEGDSQELVLSECVYGIKHIKNSFVPDLSLAGVDCSSTLTKLWTLITVYDQTVRFLKAAFNWAVMGWGAS